MEATLDVLNDLVVRGTIEKYAIGGAVAAIFWVEPFDTIAEAPFDKTRLTALIEEFELEKPWATFALRYPELAGSPRIP